MAGRIGDFSGCRKHLFLGTEACKQLWSRDRWPNKRSQLPSCGVLKHQLKQMMHSDVEGTDNLTDVQWKQVVCSVCNERVAADIEVYSIPMPS